MNTPSALCIITGFTSIILLAILFKPPGPVAIGFRLPCVMLLSAVGVTFFLWSGPLMQEEFGVEINYERMNIFLVWFNTISWLVILTPYSPKIRKRRAAMLEDTKQE